MEGFFDLTVFEDVQQRYAEKILSNPVLLIKGQANRFGVRGLAVVVKEVRTVREFCCDLFRL